jgi:hypothetical protein
MYLVICSACNQKMILLQNSFGNVMGMVLANTQTPRITLCIMVWVWEGIMQTIHPTYNKVAGILAARVRSF